jgi:hypothetical protein
LIHLPHYLCDSTRNNYSKEETDYSTVPLGLLSSCLLSFFHPLRTTPAPFKATASFVLPTSRMASAYTYSNYAFGRTRRQLAQVSVRGSQGCPHWGSYLK